MAMQKKNKKEMLSNLEMPKKKGDEMLEMGEEDMDLEMGSEAPEGEMEPMPESPVGPMEAISDEDLIAEMKKRGIDPAMLEGESMGEEMPAEEEEPA